LTEYIFFLFIIVIFHKCVFSMVIHTCHNTW